MTTRPIEVWAPLAQRVCLHVRDARIPLVRKSAEWWTSAQIGDEAALHQRVPEHVQHTNGQHTNGQHTNGQHTNGQHTNGSAHDWPPDFSLTDYWLSVDDGPPRPDPRSAWQPYGVHGPSRQVNHQDFPWTDRNFQARPLSSAVMYELHVGTFSKSGTFTGAIEHLDHLVQLGVTHVELMPVAEVPGEFGWGYDGVCLYAPSSVYGGPQALKQFVNACHARGLAVILDVVYNHLGPVGNHLAEFGPYFTDRHTTPWGPAINFDGPHSDQVRRFFCDNALLWLGDYHIDALRLDAVHAIVDTTAYPFLEQLADEVAQLGAHLGRHLTLIAESDLNDPRLIRAAEAGGYGLDAQWCDDFHHALHTALTGEDNGYYADFGSIEMLGAAYQQPYVYAGQFAPARGRSHGRSPHPLTGHRFITYSQNHDQIGNRARGERLGHLIGIKLAKVAAALVMTSPYVPQLFQGEEWFSDSPFLYFADWSQEPALAEAVRRGRQEEFAAFGWSDEELFDPVDKSTFQRCKLDWQRVAEPECAEMLNWYRQLIALRRAEPDLTSGRLDNSQVHVDETAQCLVVRRGRLMLAVNLHSSPHTIAWTSQAAWQCLLSSSDHSRLVENSEGISLHLDAQSVAILGRQSLQAAHHALAFNAQEPRVTNEQIMSGSESICRP